MSIHWNKNKHVLTDWNIRMRRFVNSEMACLLVYDRNVPLPARITSKSRMYLGYLTSEVWRLCCTASNYLVLMYFLHFSLVGLLLMDSLTDADMFLHNPRGSNNRLNGAGTNRANNNRMFDSQVICESNSECTVFCISIWHDILLGSWKHIFARNY